MNPYTVPTKAPMSTGKKVGIGVAVFFGIALLANACDSKTDTVPISGLGAATTVNTPTSVVPTTPAGPKTTFGPGIYLVGTQIEPGQYQAPGGELCYYERRSDTSSSFDGIIANEAALDGSQQIITIEPTDVAFKSQGCGTWTKIG